MFAGANTPIPERIIEEVALAIMCPRPEARVVTRVVIIQDTMSYFRIGVSDAVMGVICLSRQQCFNLCCYVFDVIFKKSKHPAERFFGCRGQCALIMEKTQWVGKHMHAL